MSVDEADLARASERPDHSGGPGRSDYPGSSDHPGSPDHPSSSNFADCWNTPDVADAAAAAALVGLPGMGPRRLQAVLSGRTPVAAWAAIVDGDFESFDRLGDCSGLRSSDLGAWHRAARTIDPSTSWSAIHKSGVHVEFCADGIELHRSSVDPEPPIVLFRRGRPIPEGPRVAIVGTRRATAYGRHVAGELGAQLAERGIAVVSGLATGIDGAAHVAALDRAGPCVAVVGSGLDVVYPPRHAALWERMADEGTLLSEYPPGTTPSRWRFPARNRIIAGLADVVVVVESAERGGSMHTVDAAVERNRLVMAVPGPVTSRVSSGTNRLVAEGCPPVSGVDDVVVALGLAADPMPVGATARGQHDPEPDRTGEHSGPVLDALGWEPTTTESLMIRTGLPVAEVQQRLLELRAAGVVEDRGGWWERAR